ncbi:unnamed protein product [Acanthoscelides obtectus]|uniref:Uncharacterized protein n=1 Tax=Acanthoscelides obtectus TaxID=200917 RepID=A0A9P0JSB1_ACAOB|nr:unnamed protein product [Acanthoscelides obtectus]CAK1642255.1 hypothetical protein AOBTE_LOCUS12925 [Acanthoscelides obtectus]
MSLTCKAANLLCTSRILSSNVFKIRFTNWQDFSIILSSNSFLYRRYFPKTSLLIWLCFRVTPRVFLLDRHNFPRALTLD